MNAAERNQLRELRDEQTRARLGIPARSEQPRRCLASSGMWSRNPGTRCRFKALRGSDYCRVHQHIEVEA